VRSLLNFPPFRSYSAYTAFIEPLGKNFRKNRKAKNPRLGGGVGGETREGLVVLQNAKSIFFLHKPEKRLLKSTLQ
jgi:hypothetical protein